MICVIIQLPFGAIDVFYEWKEYLFVRNAIFCLDLKKFALN